MLKSTLLHETRNTETLKLYNKILLELISSFFLIFLAGLVGLLKQKAAFVYEGMELNLLVLAKKMTCTSWKELNPTSVRKIKLKKRKDSSFFSKYTANLLLFF
jgi:hypothetical protein